MTTVTAIVGTYRKGGVIDGAVDAILASAKESGADVSKVTLTDKHIEFCNNCRACTQKPGAAPGDCPLKDDMAEILAQLERSDALVLASPMNFWTVTAVMKRFIERLIVHAYWPWGAPAPKIRRERLDKRAVIVGSSAAPAFVARLMTGMVGLLKTAAELLGARTVGVLFIGFAAQAPKSGLSVRNEAEARRLGRLLAAPAGRSSFPLL